MSALHPKLPPRSTGPRQADTADHASLQSASSPHDPETPKLRDPLPCLAAPGAPLPQPPLLRLVPRLHLWDFATGLAPGNTALCPLCPRARVMPSPQRERRGTCRLQPLLLSPRQRVRLSALLPCPPTHTVSCGHPAQAPPPPAPVPPGQDRGLGPGLPAARRPRGPGPHTAPAEDGGRGAGRSACCSPGRTRPRPPPPRCLPTPARRQTRRPPDRPHSSQRKQTRVRPGSSREVGDSHAFLDAGGHLRGRTRGPRPRTPSQQTAPHCTPAPSGERASAADPGAAWAAAPTAEVTGCRLERVRPAWLRALAAGRGVAPARQRAVFRGRETTDGTPSPHTHPRARPGPGRHARRLLLLAASVLERPKQPRVGLRGRRRAPCSSWAPLSPKQKHVSGSSPHHDNADLTLFLLFTSSIHTGHALQYRRC